MYVFDLCKCTLLGWCGVVTNTVSNSIWPWHYKYVPINYKYIHTCVLNSNRSSFYKINQLRNKERPADQSSEYTCCEFFVLRMLTNKDYCPQHQTLPNHWQIDQVPLTESMSYVYAQGQLFLVKVTVLCARSNRNNSSNHTTRNNRKRPGSNKHQPTNQQTNQAPCYSHNMLPPILCISSGMVCPYPYPHPWSTSGRSFWARSRKRGKSEPRRSMIKVNLL